ncbi:mucin-like protein [Patiria miniata]|uniref:Mucin-like protein n=1 Tax=Patiria miniata TaxID=46514 RepID=A0A913Z2L7_PATMI|nr:mucin-like protein [Patiria miniata]
MRCLSSAGYSPANAVTNSLVVRDSCVGRCFLDGPRFGDCWCDAACELTGDCCSDYIEHCQGAHMPTTTAQPAVDECNPDAPLHNCDDNAICNDTFEGFSCTCRPGYAGNGVYCTDVEPPSITCPADFTVYTDCRKSYSTVSLPDVQSASDNSGQYTISINIGGSMYEVGDTTTLSLGASPHMVRYTATDNSNTADCDTNVTVAEVSDGTFCEETGSPPNCICKSNEGLDCTCFYKNCGHDCSQSAEGVECTGPGKPYPKCTDVDLCDPGYSGPRCDSDSNTLQCPEVDNRCISDRLSSVEISWTLGPPGSSSDVTCTDSFDGATVETTGGVFGVGMHHVVCSSATNAFPHCLISFSVSYFPSLTVPKVGGQCTDPGMNTSTVTWTEVHATDAGEVTIDCTDSGDGVGVGVAGGVFGVGPHIITCRAVNDVGCSRSKLFTFNVVEGNLVPFGEEIGDSLLLKEPQRPHLAKDLISPTIYPPNFFPFGSKLYEKIYFTDNGVIVLSNDQSLDKRAFPSPRGKTFLGDRTMIAPFWADVKANAFTATDNVFWQVHDQYDPNVNQNMLDVASLIVSAYYSGFSANWALSITWRNVKAISPLEDTNTFQALLVTDGVRAFVVFNYDPCGMNWDTSFLPNKNVIQGYTSGVFGETVYVDIPEESQFRPGGIVGNTGKAGRWVYQLDSLPDGFVNPRLSCHNWYHRQEPYPLFAIHYPPLADTCPCSLWNARFDWRYTEASQSVVLPDDGNSYPAVCYVRLFQVSWIPGPLCCYNLVGRDLVYDVRSARVASVFERYPLGPIFYTADSFDLWKSEEVLPRYYCCQKSTLCHLYRTWRPLMTCGWYRPPAWMWGWGDPHVVTLDELEYSFNGLGEYTLSLIEDDDGQRVFELQGRTRQAVDTETGELSKATVYSGFAAVYTGEAKIEIKLSEDAIDLITTVNGTVVTPTAEGLQFDNLQVTRAENPIKVSVMYSEYVSFTVGVNNSMADITVLFNEDFKGKTKGILGVWDDDPSNDVLTRNGTLQTGSGDNGELVERDYFEFGETWRVVEEDSLFFYQSPDESYDSLNDPNFTPDFLQDLIDKAPPGKYDEAKAVCGSSNECLYDSLALNDTSIGMATSTLNEMNMENMAIATNFPPNITLVDTIEVIVGKNFILQLEAVDPDGDDVTFDLLEMVAEAAISASGRFSWTPQDKSKVKIGFLATDGKANATLEPIVKLCDCQNYGTCLFDQYASGVDIVRDRFGVVLCQCEPGWSGEFCEENYDACADNPCFLNVDCVDEDPPSLNSTCGPCQAGLEGDGKSCQDIDECELYKDQPASGGGLGCDQNCHNILMNFTCSCNAGYLLHEDGKRCIYVTDECHLSALSCLNGGTFDAEFCECVCPLTHSGMTCADENRCLSSNRCGNDQYCLPSNDPSGFTCHCNIIQGFVEGDSGQCQHYPSKNAVITALMDFNDAFKNPTSKAFNKTATVFENAILKTLKDHPSTNDVLSVVVPLLEEGSVVIRSVALFGTAAPSNAILREVLSSSDTLTDGSTVINIDQNSILVDDEAIDCVPTYCMNGGTCETSGIFPYKNYACRCPEAFSGKRCESEVLPHPEDGLSTLALAFIISGSIALAVVVVVVLVCIVLHKQSLQAKVSANHRNKVAPIIVEEAVVDNISDPTDLKEGLEGHEAFAMSYMASGMENRSDDTADDVDGYVDRNPHVC